MSESAKIDDGGPAFPVLRQHGFDREIIGSAGGMTLRDYFAGQALTGILADPNGPYKAAAEQAYELADVMLAERAK